MGVVSPSRLMTSTRPLPSLRLLEWHSTLVHSRRQSVTWLLFETRMVTPSVFTSASPDIIDNFGHEQPPPTHKGEPCAAANGSGLSQPLLPPAAFPQRLRQPSAVAELTSEVICQWEKCLEGLSYSPRYLQMGLPRRMRHWR